MRGLHAAGAAGLFAAPRIVQPDIDALHHLARHLHVVVFQEHHVLPELGIARKLHDLADVSSCPAGPSGCALPAITICTGMSLFSSRSLQPLDIAEDQRGALIGGEAARKADGERVRIQHFAGAPHFRAGRLAPHRAGDAGARARTRSGGACAGDALPAVPRPEYRASCSQIAGSLKRSRQSGSRY